MHYVECKGAESLGSWGCSGGSGMVVENGLVAEWTGNFRAAPGVILARHQQGGQGAGRLTDARTRARPLAVPIRSDLKK